MTHRTCRPTRSGRLSSSEAPCARKDAIAEVGKGGISDTLVQQVSDALRKRELIKIHVLDNCPLSAREAAEELSEKTESDVVQVIGSRLVLFKRNPKEPVIKF